MKDSFVDGVARRRVDILRPGDRVDLFRDPIADPEEGDDHPEFAFEFATVDRVALETTDCVLVETSQGAFGFPPDHMIKVDADQALPGLSRRKPLAEAQTDAS